MSKSDAEEYLNVTPTMLQPLVKGLAIRPINGVHALDAKDIQRMGAELISTIEIAARGGVRASRWLRNVKLDRLPSVKPRMYSRAVIEETLNALEPSA